MYYLYWLKSGNVIQRIDFGSKFYTPSTPFTNTPTPLLLPSLKFYNYFEGKYIFTKFPSTFLFCLGGKKKLNLF